MDDIDRKLLMLIREDPRMPSRELARRLGISKKTVQQRMHVLTKKGVFKEITPGFNIYYIDSVRVLIFGRSNAASIEGTIDRLGESEFTRGATIAGGNFLYVVGVLRDMHGLDSYVEFVKRTAEMPSPTVGLPCLHAGIIPDWHDGAKRRESYRKLTPLDLRIVDALGDDVRKPIADIAGCVGVSAKTVRRHLENMISGGMLEFYAPWDIPAGADMFTLIHVTLREGADKVKVGRRFLSKYPLQTLHIRSFSNLPSFLLCTLCSDKMTEMRRVFRLIGEDEDVLAIMPNLVYSERQYAAWRDKLTADQIRPSSRAEKRDLHSRPAT